MRYNFCMKKKNEYKTGKIADRDFSQCRSNGYQWVIQECPTSPENISDYSDSQGFSKSINDAEIREELYDINEKLNKAFWRLIETVLTPRQKEVIKLSAGKDPRFPGIGKTQVEVAKILNVNQSSVTKSIHGNCDYRNGRKVYGGAQKKLQKAADRDPEIIELLKRKYQIIEEID